MDGRVRAIGSNWTPRLTETPILAYAAKFASAFYGPFREAANPRRSLASGSYQMDARMRARHCGRRRWTFRKGRTSSWSSLRWLTGHYLQGEG